MKKVKFFAILMTVCFVSTIALPMQAVLAHNASQMFSSEEPFIVDFSKIEFSVEEFSKDYYRISYIVGNESVHYDVINDINKEVVILLLDGEEIYRIP
ncbi:MAG: hypothetical protein QCH99_04820 [Candidatus Bathyarchaeota archaeon]|nr:hypothetical protein [Candidatus Bathyarchaeum tardum]